jgi:N-acetylglucosaminyldiphosphoundecaprenol N-acetyl-beta-D-mannosaminyltransferase
MKQISRKIDYYRTIKLLGVRVDFVSLPKALSGVENLVKSDKQYQIMTTNSEHIVLSQNDYRFKKIINQSTLSTADGSGVVWAARILDQTKKTMIKYQRLSGIDLMTALCRLAAKKKWRVFLLGGKNNVAAQAAEKLKKFNYPIRSVFGYKDGPLRQSLKIDYFQGPKNIKKETKAERRLAIKAINKFKPHLLFVAYGTPMQEKWIAANLKKLKVKVAMGVGGAFDILAGRVKRAPRRMRKMGLEWSWRLICQPWRWRRQLRLIKFVFLVLKEKLNIKPNTK